MFILAASQSYHRRRAPRYNARLLAFVMGLVAVVSFVAVVLGLMVEASPCCIASIASALEGKCAVAEAVSVAA